jgi:hypothetical protein
MIAREGAFGTMFPNGAEQSKRFLRYAAVAKRARSASEPTQNRNGAGASRAGTEQGETVAGYFRKVFQENPKLLKQRSNEELFRRWMADHPGHDEVPKYVRTGLQNIKSVLRNQPGKKKGGRPAQAAARPQAAPAQRIPRRAPSRELQALEEQIDECMALAKDLDRDGLREVIAQLRDARNEVVRKLGGG